MLIFYVILIIFVIAAGVFLHQSRQLHWTAFAAVAAVALLLPWPTHAITMAVAKSDQQTFHEYWNGFETGTALRDITCVRDGSCVNTYDCDPYQVTEVEHYTDSDGKSRTRTKTVTKYHSCPYSSQETTYYVDTTLKTFTVASNLMTGEPFRWTKAIPGGQVTEPPALWREAKGRIDSGNPGPATMVNSYKNYILASESSLLKRYSSIIEELKESEVLPKIASGTHTLYQADKVQTVGNVRGVNVEELTASLSRLNGAVGDDLHGDLHLVLVEAKAIQVSSEDYSNALMAYWQDSKVFGRDALSKNSLVLVVAVNPPRGDAAPTVKWGRMFTGMPLGNEGLIQEISSKLPGVSLDGNFLGNPRFDIASGEIIHSEGVVETMLWGPNQFIRVSMDPDDDEDTGTGFSYLSDEWRPDTGVYIAYFTISGFIFLGALIGGFFLTRYLKDEGVGDPLHSIFSHS